MVLIDDSDLERAKANLDYVEAWRVAETPTILDPDGVVRTTLAGVQAYAEGRVDESLEVIDSAVAKTTADADRSEFSANIATSVVNPKLTIAEGVSASTGDGYVFTVYKGGVDGLKRTTQYSMKAGIAVPVIDPVSGREFDAALSIGKYSRTKYWGGIVDSNGGIGVVFRKADGRPIFGAGGDIVGRVESIEPLLGVVENSTPRLRRRDLILALTDSTKTKSLVEVRKNGDFYSNGRNLTAGYDQTQVVGTMVQPLQAARSKINLAFLDSKKALMGCFRAGRLEVLGRDVLGEIDALRAIPNQFISPSKNRDFFGDSQTQGGLISGQTVVPYPTHLATLMPAQTQRNTAIGGQTSTESAGRAGATKFLVVVAGGVIPASGAVDVVPYVRRSDGTYVSVVTSAIGSTSMTGTLNGVAGVLYKPTYGAGGAPALGSYTFTRSSEGAAIRCPDYTPFNVPLPSPEYGFNTIIIAVGRNNITNTDQVKRDILSLVNLQRTVEKRILILTPTNGGSLTPGVSTTEGIGSSVYAAVVEIEKFCETEFTDPGIVVFNQRRFFLERGDGSADDNDDRDKGTVPRSKRIDFVHLSTDAHFALANEGIYPIFTTKAWV